MFAFISGIAVLLVALTEQPAKPMYYLIAIILIVGGAGYMFTKPPGRR